MLVGARLGPLRRLRWRRRGAWQWPAFGCFVVLDALSLHLLPVAGEGPSPAAALVLAGFLNLAVVGALAPVVGRGVRRVRPDLPRVVANDYAGTGLVIGAGIAVVALGLAHRPQVAADERSFRAQADAVRSYVLANAPAIYRAHLARADTWRVSEHLYRTCVPGGTRAQAMCMYVDTSGASLRLRRDTNPAPNQRLFGVQGPYSGR